MSDKDDRLPPSSTEAPSIGTLIGQLSDQVTRLVRAELASAKAELAVKAKAGGIGIGLCFAGAFLALYGIGFLFYSAMAGLANAVPLWLAALIVAVVLLGLTGTLVGVGVKLLKKATPPSPEITTKSVKDDVNAIKEGFKS